MKFYSYSSSKEFKEFIVEELPEIEMALICFSESDRMKFIRLLAEKNTEFIKENLNKYCLYAIGEDGYRYAFRSEDGDYKKCGRFSLNKLYRYVEKQKEYAKYVQGTHKLLDEYNHNTILSDKPTISKYKKYSYIDKQGSQVFKFRFKQVKSKDKKPLFIYFHGAGCMGYNNTTQKIEYDLSIGNLMPEKCHILLPQANYFDNQGAKKIDKYLNGVKLLIEDLILNHNIDTNRIYIVGTSFGGCCVAYAV